MAVVCHVGPTLAHANDEKNLPPPQFNSAPKAGFLAQNSSFSVLEVIVFLNFKQHQITIEIVSNLGLWRFLMVVCVWLNLIIHLLFECVALRAGIFSLLVWSRLFLCMWVLSWVMGPSPLGWGTK